MDLRRQALIALCSELRLKKKGSSNTEKATLALSALDPQMAAALRGAGAQQPASAGSSSTSGGAGGSSRLPARYVVSNELKKLVTKLKSDKLPKTACMKQYQVRPNLLLCLANGTGHG